MTVTVTLAVKNNVGGPRAGGVAPSSKHAQQWSPQTVAACLSPENCLPGIHTVFHNMTLFQFKSTFDGYDIVLLMTTMSLSCYHNSYLTVNMNKIR